MKRLKLKSNLLSIRSAIRLCTRPGAGPKLATGITMIALLTHVACAPAQDLQPRGLQTQDLKSLPTPDAQTWIPNEPAFSSLSMAVNLPNAPKKPIEKVRVKIFPHQGRYVAPQGRETQIKSFEISSQQDCRVYSIAESPKVLLTATKVHFSESSFEYPVRVECDAPFKLIREAPLYSYRYRGDLIVQNTEDGLTAINEVDFEQYIRGVVPSEMPIHWPLEALKAQAVAARTYATLQILRARARSDSAGDSEFKADVSDTVADQAYTGISSNDEKSDQAVAETSNEILTSSNQVIKAFFHANSGGYTEDSKNAFDQPTSYCKAVPEMIDMSLVADNEWSVELRRLEITKIFRAKKLISENQKIKSIEIVSNFKSGRVDDMKIVLFDGKELLLDGQEFYVLLGLKSTLFKMYKLQNQAESGPIVYYRIAGKGWGHGVGMSQYGARVMAESLEQNYEQILKFYYAGVEIKDLSESTQTE